MAFVLNSLQMGEFMLLIFDVHVIQSKSFISHVNNDIMRRIFISLFLAIIFIWCSLFSFTRSPLSCTQCENGASKCGFFLFEVSFFSRALGPGISSWILNKILYELLAFFFFWQERNKRRREAKNIYSCMSFETSTHPSLLWRDWNYFENFIHLCQPASQPSQPARFIFMVKMSFTLAPSPKWPKRPFSL